MDNDKGDTLCTYVYMCVCLFYLSFYLIRAPYKRIHLHLPSSYDWSFIGLVNGGVYPLTIVTCWRNRWWRNQFILFVGFIGLSLLHYKLQYFFSHSFEWINDLKRAIQHEKIWILFFTDKELTEVIDNNGHIGQFSLVAEFIGFSLSHYKIIILFSVFWMNQ